MSLGPGRTFRFGDFELDPHTLELRRSGVLVKLQQQPARVLAILVERAGELVTRDSLQKLIWDDKTFVDFDRGLNYCMSQIRTALGDTADAPRYLETLRGRGYRFIGRLDSPSSADPALVASPPQPPARIRPIWFAAAAAGVMLLFLGSLAARYTFAERTPVPAIGVADFVVPRAERQWAEALHVQIVSRLSNGSRLPVIDLADRSSSNVNPRWRIEGRVDRSEELYRVTVLLRDARDGSVAWSDVFAGRPGDWVDAQSEVADHMTAAIRDQIEGPRVGMLKRRQRLPPNRSMAPPAPEMIKRPASFEEKSGAPASPSPRAE